MKHGVLNAVRVRREIAAKGLRRGLTIFRDFMVPHRPVYGAKVAPRFETEPGRPGSQGGGQICRSAWTLPGVANRRGCVGQDSVTPQNGSRHHLTQSGRNSGSHGQYDILSRFWAEECEPGCALHGAGGRF